MSYSAAWPDLGAICDDLEGQLGDHAHARCMGARQPVRGVLDRSASLRGEIEPARRLEIDRRRRRSCAAVGAADAQERSAGLSLYGVRYASHEDRVIAGGVGGVEVAVQPAESAFQAGRAAAVV